VYGKMDNTDDRMALSCFKVPSAIRFQGNLARSRSMLNSMILSYLRMGFQLRKLPNVNEAG
jgi:hypothetical protein